MELTLFRVKGELGTLQWLCTDKDLCIEKGDFIKIKTPNYNFVGVAEQVYYKVPNLDLDSQEYTAYASYHWRYISDGITVERRLLDLTLFTLRDSMSGTIKRFAVSYRVIKGGDFITISSDSLGHYAGKVEFVYRYTLANTTGCTDLKSVQYYGDAWMFVSNPTITVMEENFQSTNANNKIYYTLTMFQLRSSTGAIVKRFCTTSHIGDAIIKGRLIKIKSTCGVENFTGTVERVSQFTLNDISPLNEASLPAPYSNLKFGMHQWLRILGTDIELLSESPSNNNTINISKTNSMKTNKIFDTMIERFKAQFMPVVDESLQVTMDGEVAVPTKEGDFVAIKGEELTSYPAEMTLDMPVYVLAKKIEDVKVGDIIKNGSSYSKVTKVNKNNQGKLVSFSTLSYGGHGKTVKPITDFLMGQSTVKVVINLMTGFGSIDGINPMMLMALKDGDSDNSLMMLMLMQQMNGGAQAGTSPFGNINPMMLMLMNGEDNNDIFKTMMMMQMMQGNMNLFGAAPAATPAE